MNKLVKDLFGEIKKPPQKSYGQRLRDTLRVVLINLCDQAVNEDWISYHRDRRAPENQKYSWFTANYLCQVVDYLFELGLIDNRAGFFSQNSPNDSYPSKMRATQRLKDILKSYNLNDEGIECVPNRDLIILKDNNGVQKHFSQNAFTRRSAQILININKFNKEQNFTIANKAMNRKYYHRVFNGDFEHGGRFYGPEWEWRRKEFRSTICINGERTVELDYCSIHPSILYALVRKPFSNDLYRAPGYPCDSESDRKFIKRATLTRINACNDRAATRSIQKAINFGELEKPTWLDDIANLIKAIVRQHEPISHLFNARTGGKLQRLDSELCQDIIVHFLAHGIPVLSVHDSFIVSETHCNSLRNFMEKAFYNKFNVKCNIEQKAKKN